jgi:hypothetical protein
MGLKTVAAKVFVLPLVLVVTLLWRRNVLPSLSEGLENNCIVNVVPGVCWGVPPASERAQNL